MLGSEDTEVNGTDKVSPLRELYSGGRLRAAGKTLTKKVWTKRAAGGND